MTHHRTHLAAVRSVTVAFTLLAGITGLMWPKSNIQAEDTIQPTPVRTLSYRSPMQPIDEPPAYPAWTVRPDGLWVPWTMQPPAWWTAIASAPVSAEAVPLPPERPVGKTPPSSEGGSYPTKPLPRRIAREGDVCARVGLTKTYTDKYRWRCR